ncbi:MAG: extracellular solute-binding protein [Defluviitaleaceae bacterium]|nr:extracellular solute-binding protein [Defluviitaleaceae bacterium]
MKKHWKLMLSALMLGTVFALVACGDNGEPAQPAPTPVGQIDTTIPPERDLGGMEINIATWWVEEDTATADPQSAAMVARWADRAAMEDRYNFTMRYVRYGSWHDVRDNISQELLAGNRDFQIWVMEGTWFATHHSQNLFAPIPRENFEDDFGIEWITSILDLTTRDGSPHGFAHEVGMAGGIYFNMRLFEEAGIERDLPFQLQAENNWTWDTFTDLARRLSVDRGEGAAEVWPITTFNSDFLMRALASNGASYATVDPVTGNFVNNTNTIEFLETIQWVVSLRDEMLTMHEADVGGEWNVYRQMFNDGQGAMMSGGNYVAGARVNPSLVDDWGFVAFPRGPRMDYHHSWVNHNVNAIPHFYNPDEVSNIMFAMQRWIRPLEDDDPYDWIFENLVNHSDPRSVEETMMYFTRNPSLQSMPAHSMMPGLGEILGENFAWRVWSGNEPAVIVEEAQLVWNAFLDRVNAM